MPSNFLLGLNRVIAKNKQPTKTALLNIHILYKVTEPLRTACLFSFGDKSKSQTVAENVLIGVKNVKIYSKSLFRTNWAARATRCLKR